MSKSNDHAADADRCADTKLNGGIKTDSRVDSKIEGSKSKSSASNGSESNNSVSNSSENKSNESVNGEGPVSACAYDKVVLARDKNRATGSDYIKNIFTDFIEMHGDRRYSDDKAIISGIGVLDNTPFTVIAIEKGHTTEERIERNFGSVNPEGYRKALRQMKLAEKFHRPVVCFVDTSGAFCGIGAEERGQGQAIAENLMEMMTLKTPVISILIGEGGSGGALALAVASEVWMLENAIYSVISPEGCASILWKDPSKAKEAAESLKLTAADLYRMNVIEEIIEEPEIFSDIYEDLSRRIAEHINYLESLETEILLQNRYQKFRKIGL